MEFENLGSLITIKGTDNCLGYLMSFGDKGVFDATHGKVDVSKEHTDIHNRLLDEAMLEGLDKNCQVGQGGTFYTARTGNKTVIKTFLGTLVSDAVTMKSVKSRYRQHILTFRRNGKVYRGRTSHEHDLFNFRRVA